MPRKNKWEKYHKEIDQSKTKRNEKKKKKRKTAKTKKEGNKQK